MNPRYPAIADRAGHRCEYCRAPEAIFNLAFEVEHIIPSSLGGSDTVDNLALACRACNLSKADFRSGIDETNGSEIPLFHPRNEQWSDHFQTNSGTAELVGLSPTGRVTLKRLKMNDSTGVTARRFWIQIRLFSWKADVSHDGLMTHSTTEANNAFAKVTQDMGV